MMPTEADFKQFAELLRKDPNLGVDPGSETPRKKDGVTGRRANRARLYEPAIVSLEQASVIRRAHTVMGPAKGRRTEYYIDRHGARRRVLPKD